MHCIEYIGTVVCVFSQRQRPLYFGTYNTHTHTHTHTHTQMKDKQTSHCFEKFTRCAKVYGLFSWLCFSGADWLSRQSPVTFYVTYLQCHLKHTIWICFSAKQSYEKFDANLLHDRKQPTKKEILPDDGAGEVKVRLSLQRPALLCVQAGFSISKCGPLSCRCGEWRNVIWSPWSLTCTGSFSAEILTSYCTSTRLTWGKALLFISGR